jgi:transposase InsO family protein
VIRAEAGMSTAGFCRLVDMPERTWRRWQARARAGWPVKGPWPAPVAERVEAVVVKHAEKHPAWGHRKVWAMTRYDGQTVSASTVLRVLRRRGLITESVAYQRERRQLAAARRAAFLTPPTGPLQVWQLDFSEFETHGGGVWRLAGCADYWSKYEFGWHLSPTGNQHDAIAAVELALTEAERLAGRPLRERLTDPATEQLRPITVVTDNGGPFRSARFARFIDDHPELTHVRIKARSPGQNGVRERAFGSLKYERLYLHDITDGHELWSHAQDYRTEFNHVRPHEALAWHRPIDVHLGQADPTEPNLETDRTLPTP